jgi:hypothetical protein
VDEQGRRKAVVMKVADYRRMLQYIEDLEDALELDKAVRTGGRFRDYQGIRAELKKAGHL